MDSGAVPHTVSVDRMASGDHACLGFDSHEARWAIRAAFTEAGLCLGERVILFAGPGTTPEETAVRLAEHGVPAAQALRDDRLLVINEIPGYDPERGFDPEGRAATWIEFTENANMMGFSGLRATGDMSWALEPGVDHQELVDYETGLTPLFADIGFTAICEYDLRLFPPELMCRVNAAHPTEVLPSLDALHITRTGTILHLAGNADLATREQFDADLRKSLRGPGPPPRLIDLTALSFIDAHCATTLIRLAAGLSPTARLAVHCPPTHARVLRLCGADDIPQLTLYVESSW
ncbi:MEDS domain-containing protein [Streptomyces sp. H10-C2]|uniref:MEDS domain-containing protein n=1 Tax=unclassified Streptomyces TaxID=2593676 RepID=UPI0024BADA97|nr:MULTISPECIES: MEDS domain-containing protein [unclassified Streptomyces]MDJ0342105.1 MEDS domain-containing protein [Streptomyces sp. PH10-H1]MDJ0368447.1 MEDS domain-containing protein [Streptomyces sp. H10-C2]